MSTTCTRERSTRRRTGEIRATRAAIKIRVKRAIISPKAGAAEVAAGAVSTEAATTMDIMLTQGIRARIAATRMLTILIRTRRAPRRKGLKGECLILKRIFM